MWFGKKGAKKEKSELPELPPLPKIQSPGLPKLPSEIPPIEKSGEKPLEQPPTPPSPLPSFPPSRTGEQISQEIVKQTINGEMLKPETSGLKEVIPKTRVVEFPEPPSPMRGVAMKAKSEPIFVRIDKFQSALENFQKIKEQITDIENLLKEVKAIKIEEEKELEAWENEIETIKTKLNEVDKTIFKKLD